MYFLYSSVQLKTWQSCKRKHKQSTVRIFIFYLFFLNVKLCLASCWLPDLLTLLLHCHTCLDCSLFCFWVETNICGFYCFLFDIFPLEIQLVKKGGGQECNYRLEHSNIVVSVWTYLVDSCKLTAVLPFSSLYLSRL